ncbi:vq domain-containing protein [Abeliophyllum distichum]|uniref:Vq domain-containing protein n=1 Tax=Abeliophyllum distichum TaxID=126358 RepID=A0ABD1NS91_9LAMI
MDSYGDDTSLSSSTQFPSYQQQEKKSKQKQFSSFHSALHSVRKPMQKPPTGQKIYNVDPVNFKEIVQMLTAGSYESQPTRLQEVAPPPLSLFPQRQQPVVNDPSVKKPLSSATPPETIGNFWSS